MGVAFADFNADGRMDIYVANDSMRNFLFENLGGGKFREAGLEYGASLGDAGRAIASMAVDFRDYDNDGKPDLLVTGMVNDSYLLFHNLGSPLFFEDSTAMSGLAAATRNLTGWGGGFADFDNDGWKDIFVANAHFPQMGRLIGKPAPLPNTVFRNLANGRFADVSAGAGLGGAAYHRGVAFADFDGDGLVDVVVTRINEPARLYRNVTKGAGRSIVLNEPLGTQVEVELPDGRKLYNHASTSVGYASGSEPGVRCGIGSFAKPKRVRVRRPGEEWKIAP
jgi:enediyne biosynthesis protein E4